MSTRVAGPMNNRKIRIKSPLSMNGTQVWINDKEIDNAAIRSVSWRHEAGSLPIVTVELVADEIEIEGEAEIEEQPFEGVNWP